jgi:hypothetical protein
MQAARGGRRHGTDGVMENQGDRCMLWQALFPGGRRDAAWGRPCRRVHCQDRGGATESQVGPSGKERHRFRWTLRQAPCAS